MNKLILTFILSVFYFTNCFSQTCGNDSVVTRYTQENDNGTRTNKIYVDSFDLTNGRFTSRVQTLANNTVVNSGGGQGTFIRKLISYNSVQDTVEYVEMQGTGSGYTNFNKIEYTYTSSEKPLTRIMSHWNGSAWSISKSEVWTYDVSELIQNYILSDSTGNISQRNYTYSGNQQTSVIFQNDTSGNWLNIERYLITYSQTGFRDSLYLQRWDNVSGLWVDSIQTKYDTVQYRVYLKRDNLISPDSSFYLVDSLNNVIDYSYKDDGNSYLEWYTYDYFHNHLKLVAHGVNSPFTNHSRYFYDTNGLLLREEFDAASNTGTNGYSNQYDSLSNLIYYENSSSHMTGSHSTNTSYTYSSADHINFSYVFTANNSNYYTCQGDSIRAVPIIAGGCGPYTFSWNPSTGLSSDSVASPLVLFEDSVLYTITVTDTIGQSATTTFLAQPDRKLEISFDSTLCSSCPVALHATPGFFNYYWYRNDTLLDVGSSTFIAIESGIYTVEVHSFCDMVSDPVELTLPGYSRIQGRIFLDKDSDCVFNNADISMSVYGPSPYLIKLERQNYSVIVNTDSMGKYDLPVDSGNFRISLINPSNVFEYSCPDSGAVHVYVPDYGDTISGIDFGLKTKYSCNRLQVVTTSSSFQPCRPANITLTYYNEGTETENNPIVHLRLPPELINISTSQPYTLLPDNTYEFILPAIEMATFESFDIIADVICDSVALQNATLCLTADIYPINFCSYEPDSLWDGSYVRVRSSCANDSSCFTIYNIADTGSDMQNSSNWRLYADNLLIEQGTFQLQSGGDTTLCFASAGKSLRLEAEQTNLFPVAGLPKANIERCGPLLSGQSYSLDYILQSPSDNSLPFQNTFCASVNTSSATNKKSVRPIGLGPEHLTEAFELFTFRIDFQNTGNDTAHSVKIVDAIQNSFDLTSLQLLSSSHPYTFSLNNQELTWLMEPVILPGSNIDEANSHGFVEFSIKLKSTITNGALIENQAQVIFDQLRTINTNTTSNKICTPVLPEITIFPVNNLCSGRISFTYVLQNQGTLPEVKWYLNGSQLPFNTDTIEFTGVNYNDVIYATLKSNLDCAIYDSVRSNFFQIAGNPPTITYNWPQLTTAPANSYLWFFNGLVIGGATSQSYTPLANGNYTVQITDSTGCSFISLQFPFVYTSTPENISNFIEVYPNPSTGKINIETISGTKSVTLTDLTGRPLLEFDTKENNFAIDLSDKFSSGIYYLIIRCGDQVNYEKIIYQR